MAVNSSFQRRPKVAGDPLDSFDDSQWEEQGYDINSLTLRTESQRIVQSRYLTLGMDLEYLKNNFPITFELNTILCLQNLLIEYTKNQGSWKENPAHGIVTILQEDKPFECKDYNIDIEIENKFHTFKFPKQNKVLINSFPDLKVLLCAGYINNKGRLRKYKKTSEHIIIGSRVIKRTQNIALRPGLKRKKTYVDVIKHTEKGTNSKLDLTIEDINSEERSNQNCKCQETSEILALQAQICYSEDFYDRKKILHRDDNVVKDLTPWVNSEILLKNGVNQAMNSYSIDSNRLLALSEPGAVVSSTPHEKNRSFL